MKKEMEKLKKDPMTVLKEAEKVILAYSGGLDTSVLVTWLKEAGVKDVICVAGNLGQIKDVEALEAKAMKTGASKFYCLDLKDEYVEDYVFPALKAGAKYEGQYLLGTATARPLIAKGLVEIADKEGTEVIVHGCTGKGNDQVRFEMTMMAINPDLKVVAPWRFWELESRSDELAYAEKHGIPLTVKADNDYSMDENIWHLSHEGLDLEDTANEADWKKILKWAKTPEEAPEEACYVEIDFEQGIPVALDGEKMSAAALVEKLNEIGGLHGIGVDDIVENRLVGMKSRGIYENPAGAILYYAHEKLESIVLDADTLHFKQPLSHHYANLVYNGKWDSPLKEALDAFVDRTQAKVTGSVKLKLYKGSIRPAGIRSPYSLYDEGYATFEQDDVYDQADATGFIKLYGLANTIRAKMGKEAGLQ